MNTKTRPARNFSFFARACGGKAAGTVRPAAVRLSAYVLCAITAAGLLFSCQQSPVFADLEQATPPVDTAIEGTPGRIVVSTGGVPFVSNGRIYQFSFLRNPGLGWKEIPGQPPGKRVQSIAVTGGFLYAQVSTSGKLADDKLYRTALALADPPQWDEVTGAGGAISAIFGAGDTLFIGMANETIRYIQDTASSPVNYGQTGLLLAAEKMGSAYFTSIRGKGLFYSAASPGAMPAQVAGTDGKSFMGFAFGPTSGAPTILYAAGGSSVAVIQAATPSTAAVKDYSGYNFTGALTRWENTTHNVLLAGRRYSGSYTHGYVEIALDPAGTTPGDIDGNCPVTLGDDKVRARYGASLGRRVINHFTWVPIWESASSTTTPSADREIFASTNLYGLWRYSEQEGEWKEEDRRN
ncbi:MAG: hypothetical protein LBC88_00230 [Spirochaetaceae bacterium]|nr:hypothetical protein [Spirochaetaceae bacterium]